MKNLIYEFGLALAYSALLLLLLFFGSQGPQFIYAMF